MKFEVKNYFCVCTFSVNYITFFAFTAVEKQRIPKYDRGLNYFKENKLGSTYPCM